MLIVQDNVSGDKTESTLEGEHKQAEVRMTACDIC